MSHSTGLVTLTKELSLAQLGRILAPWCSPGEKLQDPPEKGGFYIFCRKNHFRCMDKLTCPIQLQCVHFGYVKIAGLRIHLLKFHSSH